MLLSAAGCAQDSKRPEPTEPAASAVSETSVENVEAAEETPQKPQSSRRLDDSRISTLYDERFTYTDPYGIEDTYFYQVPQIDDDTEGAKNINEMIGYRFGYLVERALDARSRNDFIDTSYIIWVSNWDGPLLSLQITSSDAMYNHDVGSYHYNFATGQELSNPEMLAHLGYTDDAKVMHALERAVAQHFDTYYGYIDPDQTAMLYMMRAQSLSNLDGLYSYYSLYPKYSHGFVATVPMYTPAGSGMYWTDVQVDPDKRQGSGQILHGQDEWFTCDVSADGAVTVRALTDYVTPDGAMTYRQRSLALQRRPVRLYRRSVPEHRQALYLRRRGPDGSAHLLLQHQGAGGQQIRHAQPGALPRGGSARRHRHRHCHPLLR